MTAIAAPTGSVAETGTAGAPGVLNALVKEGTSQTPGVGEAW